ncbi:hypothetical protein [Microvirga vignae]|nr:hypothetical protein [Microvirga vignae]
MPGVASLLHLVSAIFIEVVVTWIVNELDGLNSRTDQPILTAKLR